MTALDEMNTLDDIDTWDQKPLFKVRRFPDGIFYLPIEVHDDPILPFLTAGALAIELKEGVTYEEANALLDALREKVAFILYTGEADPEWDDIPGRRERFGQTEDQRSA